MKRALLITFLLALSFLPFNNALANFTWWGINVPVVNNGISIDVEDTITGSQEKYAVGVNLGATLNGDILQLSFTTQNTFSANIKVYRESPWELYDEVSIQEFAAGAHAIDLGLRDSDSSQVTVIINLNLPENAGLDIDLSGLSIVINPDVPIDLPIVYQTTIIPVLLEQNPYWSQILTLQNISSKNIAPQIKLHDSAGDIIYDSTVTIESEQRYVLNIKELGLLAVYGEIVCELGKLVSTFKLDNDVSLIDYNLTAETGTTLLLNFVDDTRITNKIFILSNPNDVDVSIEFFVLGAADTTTETIILAKKSSRRIPHSRFFPVDNILSVKTVSELPIQGLSWSLDRGFIQNVARRAIVIE